MKTCSKCHTSKEAVEFGKNRAMKDGLNHYCRPCARESSKQVRAQRLERTNEQIESDQLRLRPNSMKKCPKCQDEKALEEFNADLSQADALQTSCRECSHEWRQENADKLRESRREYRAANKDAIKAGWGRYYAEHKGEIAERKKAWNEANAERVSEYGRVYRQSPAWKEQHSKHQAKRRGLVKGAIIGGDLPTAQELAEQYGKACLYPGCDSTLPTLDHVIPLSRGGSHSISNFQPLCKSHNSSKGVKIIDYRGE